MLGYILRRLLQLVFVLCGLTIFLFILFETMPGDPARVMAGLGASKEAIEAIEVKLGLDKPFYERYWRLVSGLFSGQLQSMTYHERVWIVILDRLPATVELGFFAMVLSLFVAIPAGLLSAIFRNSSLDYVVTTVALTGISIPIFWLALLLMLLFGAILRVLPVSGRGATLWGWSFLTFSGLRHLIIPAVSLSAPLTALNARLIRADMLQVLRQDYMNTARAKGVRESVVIIKHAFRNALAPVVTNIGLQMGIMIGGATLVETTTAWPGIGRLMYTAILRRDEAVVLTLALFIATFHMVSYLVVDILYVYINPKVSYE